MNPLLEKKFEIFSNLSDDECGKIIEKYLLEGLESETLLEREMITKFLFNAYPGREELTKIFNLAIRRNEQKVGTLTVGEWLKKYSLTYNNIERTPNTFFEFVRDSLETKKLSKRDQTRLMRIFRMYDYLLVEPILELDDIRMNILKFPMYLEGESQGGSYASDNLTEEAYIEKKVRKIISMTLMQAMQKYPKLGEQIVSSNVLKLRIFPTPVRPSIKNWITDYHDFAGSGKHGAVDRGNYLFQSVNGKKLNPVERQRVSDMLKALDTEENVSIDAEKEMLVFGEVLSSVPSPAPTMAYITNPTPTQTSNPVQQSVPSPSKDNMYITKVRNGNGPSLPVQNAVPVGEQQADVFDRYAKKSFSPNFADKQEFIIDKKNNNIGASVQGFRNANTAVGNDDVSLSSTDFHDFASQGRKENALDGELSFSTPQKFSVEKEQQPNIPTAPTPTPTPVLAHKPAPAPTTVPTKNTTSLNEQPTYRQSWQDLNKKQ